jgi:glycine/D-amino acid oxidase-like deaminating enzyme
MTADVVVIGAGLVGAGIAYGLAGLDFRVLVLDGGDRDFRASNANGGLIWLQGKGLLRKQDRSCLTQHQHVETPAYQRLTRDSVDLWSDFSAELTDITAIDLQYERNGGLALCMSEAEYSKRYEELVRWSNQIGGAERDWEMLDRGALMRLLPEVRLGTDVVGASLGHRDGQCNPLRLLAALHLGTLRKGGRLLADRTVRSVRVDGAGGIAIDLGSESVSAPRVVIAAGLGSKPLAAQAGLDVPIRPQRGQMLITERLQPFLPLPLHGVRQMREGTVMIGATYEEAGFDASTTTEAAASLSAKAIRQLPALSEAKLVRQWAGLRVMTPDGHPIYAQSQSHPGIFVAVCHSGVTLAAAHAVTVASAIAVGHLPSSFDAFHPRRFNVPKAA